MDQTILFDKSLQQRLEEYNSVFSDRGLLSVSGIHKEWSFYLELALDPNGWQAIWKIQRSTCEELNIPFPSVVLVLVLEVDFKEIMATVKVLAVQDDIQIAEKHVVPLIHLWPTKEQDKSVAINLNETANVLDMLRFFYNNILMPWDNDEDDSPDWIEKHLESRMRLFYDMKNGIIPVVIAEHIHALISEAKRLQCRRESLQLELLELGEGADEDLNNESVSELMEIHIRMIEIKNEVDVLENPVLRNIIIKKHKQIHLNNESQKKITWLIFDEGKVDDYMKFLEKVKEIYPNNILKFFSPLSLTLENANPGDIFILSEGLHVIKTCGVLENGGVLKGLSFKENTKITSNLEDKMFDFNADSVVIENMTINAFTAQCAIIVRRGTLKLNNCKIIGDGKSSTHQGIIVLKGAILEIENCEIFNFYTAIVGNSGSTILMKNSEIHDVKFALKVYDDCTVKVQNCILRNCNRSGLCVETEQIFEEKIGDTFDDLSIFPNITLENVKGINNAKGDVLISERSKLVPIEDLFEDPDQDPTICKNSDEEMESYEENPDATVIEKKEEMST